MLNVTLIGTGEYTTGFVHNSSSTSDKKWGVIALVMFDLRRQGKLVNINLVGTTGRKNSQIRDHLKEMGLYYNLDTGVNLYPEDHVHEDKYAYKKVLDAMKPGELVTIFTPDDTHFDIAMYALEKKLHVLLAKPAVKTVMEHVQLIKKAQENNCLVVVEFHKRYDPIYSDARDRIRALGGISYFHSYMSQPKTQLETFKKWAGRSSDISFYLNSHHIDFLCWCLNGQASPVKVSGYSSMGVATQLGCDKSTEDTITIVVEWKGEHYNGTSIHTSSWIAPKAEVHSQQRFFFLGHKGEIRVDQAHRGYEMSTDQSGYSSLNPLFMKYTPNNGRYVGQNSYGHLSISTFVDACLSIFHGKKSPNDFVGILSTIQDTQIVTAILEAGKKSCGLGRPIDLLNEDK